MTTVQAYTANICIEELGPDVIYYTYNVSKELDVRKWKLSLYYRERNGMWIKNYHYFLDRFEGGAAHLKPHPDAEFMLVLEYTGGVYINVSREFRTPPRKTKPRTSKTTSETTTSKGLDTGMTTKKMERDLKTTTCEIKDSNLEIASDESTAVVQAYSANICIEDLGPNFIMYTYNVSKELDV